VEDVVMNRDFWRGKRVFVTGHTGFKGSWLSLWLQRLGAVVGGFALRPPTTPSLYELAGVGAGMVSLRGDVRDLSAIAEAIGGFSPDIVFHLAAQALVRTAYQDPVGTYATNLMGTVHLLEVIRACPSVRVVVVATTDKCYENVEWAWGYREIDRLGGGDPYASSKACAELAVDAYRRSYLVTADHPNRGASVATVRAGNVIGGGDWAECRLIPDYVRALEKGVGLRVRNWTAVRPWQYVLEPLRGYLMLAERMFRDGPAYAEAWNFGPAGGDARPVSHLVAEMERLLPPRKSSMEYDGSRVEEAMYLHLDSAKAKQRLGWEPFAGLPQALKWVAEWYASYMSGKAVREITLKQIDQYEGLGGGDGDV
jgi:CDP-glucose 4,6-dehydratase